MIGVSLVGPIAVLANTAGVGLNSTGGCSTGYCGDLYNASTWGATVVKMVPGFFALGILGIGVAVCYSSLRQAGIV